MATLSQPQPSPQPGQIMHALMGYTQTAALTSAIELDLFTAIGEGNTEPASIARRCQASEKGVRALCDFLVVEGLLTKDAASYGLTPESAFFLDRRSPAAMGSVADFLASTTLKQAFENLTKAVRRGGTALDHEGSMEPDHPIWEQFARAMVPTAAPAAEFIANLLHADDPGPLKVLDIAAGHGLFGIAIARRNPRAEVVAVDWTRVLGVAHEHAVEAGVEDRFHELPGSAFDIDFGQGYDIVLLTNFLHHFDAPTCEQLLRKVHAALKPGGRAVTLEFVPDDNRISPPMAAGFSLMMLATTAHGDAYTYREFERMFQNAGFSRNEAHVVPPRFETVIVSER